MANTVAELELAVLTHGTPEAIGQFKRMATALKEVDTAAVSANRQQSRQRETMATFRRDQRIQTQLVGLTGLSGGPVDAALNKFEYLQAIAGNMNMTVGSMLAKFGPMAGAVALTTVAWKEGVSQLDQYNKKLTELGFKQQNLFGMVRMAVVGDNAVVDPSNMAARIMRETAKKTSAQQLADFIEKNPSAGMASWKGEWERLQKGDVAGKQRDEFAAAFDAAKGARYAPSGNRPDSSADMMSQYRFHLQAANEQQAMLEAGAISEHQVRMKVVEDLQRHVTAARELKNLLGGEQGRLEQALVQSVRDRNNRALQSHMSWINSDRTAPLAIAGSHSAAVAGFRAESEARLKQNIDQQLLASAKTQEVIDREMLEQLQAIRLVLEEMQ